MEAFFENFHRKWKMCRVELNSGTSKSSTGIYLKIAWHLKTYIDTNSSIDFENLH